MAHATDFLSKLSKKDILDWLLIATEEYFVNKVGLEAFSPLNLNGGPSLTPAQLISNSVRRSSESRVQLANTLPNFVQRMNPLIPDFWLFAADLALRIDAPEILEAVEARMMQGHIHRTLEQERPGFSDEMLAWLMNVSPVTVGNGQPHVTLIRRLLDSGYISESKSRLILVRLIEVAPDFWNHHVSVTRGHLHSQMTKIRLKRGLEAMNSFQEELAHQILDIVGPERMANSFQDLLIAPNSPDRIPTDNWLYRALCERLPIISVSADGKFLYVPTGSSYSVSNKELPLSDFSVEKSNKCAFLGAMPNEPISDDTYAAVFGAARGIGQ